MRSALGAAFVYSDQLSRHVLRSDHPLRPARLRLTYELLRALGAFAGEGSRLVEPREATREEVLGFHEPAYRAAVEAVSYGLVVPGAERYGLSLYGDNPIFPGMYEAALLSTGASLTAADLLLAGEVRVAFNSAGGLHHAMPGYASGFCVFNDPVIAIQRFVARGLRVAYVDIDAHHGDGVQHAFYETDAVITVSLHESGHYLFPGTGFVEELGSGRGRGYSVNLPLAPLTDDEVYVWAFQEVVPPLLNAYRPDVLVTQLGVDTYYRDPLAHLKLTTTGYVQVVKALAELAEGKPWLALGGGGYDLSAVARCWSLAYGVMLGREWPNELPQEHQERLGDATLRDREAPELSGEMREAAKRFAEGSVQEVRRLVFPCHGL